MKTSRGGSNISRIECSNLIDLERRHAYKQGFDHGVAIMSVDPKTVENLVKDLAKADAHVINSGRKHGRIVKPGYIWGERVTPHNDTKDKHLNTISIVDELKRLYVTVTPELRTLRTYVDYMRVYGTGTPRGRDFSHQKLIGLAAVYREQLEKSMDGVPNSPAPNNRALVTKRKVSKTPRKRSNTK